MAGVRFVEAEVDADGFDDELGFRDAFLYRTIEGGERPRRRIRP
jgi:hypothetical protein